MKKDETDKNRIIKQTVVLASVILIATVLTYAADVRWIKPPVDVRMIVAYIFPHEVFQPLKFLLLPRSSRNEVYSLPIFTCLFCIFLFVAIYYFQNLKKPKLLRIALCVLIASIILSLPLIIYNYTEGVKAYNSFGYRHEDATGITRMLNVFTVVSKPSPGKLALHFLVLAIYIFWIVNLLKSINRLEKSSNLTNNKN